MDGGLPFFSSQSHFFQPVTRPPPLTLSGVVYLRR